ARLKVTQHARRQTGEDSLRLGGRRVFDPGVAAVDAVPPAEGGVRVLLGGWALEETRVAAQHRGTGADAGLRREDGLREGTHIPNAKARSLDEDKGLLR